MANPMKRCLLAILFSIFASALPAKEASLVAKDPELDARMVRITSELRCLVCQNQTIADSHSGLAIDLRNQVREQLQQGKSDPEIIEFMTARYGDFVLYRPPVKSTTAILWFGPALLSLGGLGTLFFVLRRRSRMPDAAFDPDDVPDPITQKLNPPSSGPIH